MVPSILPFKYVRICLLSRLGNSFAGLPLVIVVAKPLHPRFLFCSEPLITIHQETVALSISSDPAREELYTVTPISLLFSSFAHTHTHTKEEEKEEETRQSKKRCNQRVRGNKKKMRNKSISAYRKLVKRFNR